MGSTTDKDGAKRAARENYDLTSDDVIGFMHCSDCGTGDRLTVGLIDEETIVILCDACELELERFILKDKMKMPTCKVCGKLLGKDHAH